MSSETKSRFGDLLAGLGFTETDDGPVPKAFRAKFPTTPKQPVFLRIVTDEEDLIAILLDETGVCWVGPGDLELETHGFVDFDEAEKNVKN